MLGEERVFPRRCSISSGSARCPRRRSERCPAGSVADSTLLSESSISPKVLFLDEPTTGFDQETRRRFWDLIRLLARDGTTSS